MIYGNIWPEAPVYTSSRPNTDTFFSLHILEYWVGFFAFLSISSFIYDIIAFSISMKFYSNCIPSIILPSNVIINIADRSMNISLS